MAYLAANTTSPNPPNLIASFLGSTGGDGRKLWMYASTHVQVDVSSTGFFSDGQTLGMNLGDPVLVIGSTTTTDGRGPASFHVVNVVTSTGVGLSAGLLVSSSS